MMDILRKLRVRDAGKRTLSTIEEVEQLHQEEFMKRRLRRCISFCNEREFQEDEMAVMVNQGFEDDVNE